MSPGKHFHRKSSSIRGNLSGDIYCNMGKVSRECGADCCTCSRPISVSLELECPTGDVHRCA